MDARSKTAIRLKFAKFALKFKGLQAVKFKTNRKKRNFERSKGLRRNTDVF